jgi:hypothetical protein
MLAFAADHDGDLAFVVELLGNLRPHQLLARADHGVRRAIEHARIFRIVGDIIVGAAIGIIDADAEDLFRRQERRQQLDLAEWHVGAHAGGGGFRLIQRLGAEHVDQGGKAAQSRAQIDDALADDRAKARTAAHIVACKAHVAVLLNVAIQRPAAAFRLTCSGMILSENRCPLFGIMPWPMC